MTPVLRRLADIETRPVSWLWRGYVPANKITLIEGDPSLGKSLLVADLLARVTTSRTMPDGSASDLPAPASVLLLASEDDASDTLKPRLLAAGADLSRVYLWEAVTTDQVTRMPLLPEDLAQLASIINEIDAKMIVIDPLSSYLSNRIDSWKDPDIRRALSPLAAMGNDLGVTIILLRHWNKSPGTDLLYRGLGSIGFTAAARSVLAVVRHPEDDNTRILFGLKSNLGPRPPALAFEIEQVGMAPVIRWKGPVELTSEDLTGAGRDPSPVRSAVLAYVKGAGRPVSSKELAEDLGLKEATARWHLHQATKDGQLVRVGAGLYRPASGSNGTTHNGVVPSHIDDTTTECGHRCYSCGGELVEPEDWPGWWTCRGCGLWSRRDDPAYARRT
jgi:putative DNA primase/helicase